MSKIGLVISREYSSRVRKRTFIIMTILGPLLFIVFYGLIVLIAVSEEEKEHVVMVVDNSAMQLGDRLHRYEVMRPNSKLKFVWKYASYEQAKDSIFSENYDAILYFPPNPISNPGLIFYRVKNRPSISIKNTLETEIEKLIEEQKLALYNISKRDFDDIRVKINLQDKKLHPDGTEENNLAEVRYGVGFASSFLIYIFILLYGIQVLRGVMEEKTNRIVEVMISSIRPFELMMGKIIGIALVGLTQFIIWIIFSGIAVSVISFFFAPSVMEQVEASSAAGQTEVAGMNVGMLLQALRDTNFLLIIPVFVFYFLGGYLLYASLFAAVGSAVDADTDTQQFMLPVTLPLVFSIAIGQMALNNPDGPMAVIFSMIPFTSPIVMMARIAGEISIWEVLLSMILLVAGFIFTTWLASRIYRTGILMYGKKVTYRELWKWLTYRG